MSSVHSASGVLLRPALQVPQGLAGWSAMVDPRQLPLLRSSALAIEEFRANEDAVDAHLLADALSQDPLAVLKVLAHVADMRRGHEGSDPETMTAALVMLGISPFFRQFGPQAVAEDLLDETALAPDGFQAVLDRSSRAGRFALAFAVQRMDHDAAVIQEAALLHDFAELLMWLYVPHLAAEVARRQSEDRTLRSSVAQLDVYGIRLADLQHALMLKWRLPQLLVDITDEHHQLESAQARNVLLAIRLARHTAVDWDNPALGDDVSEIAGLLNMSAGPTLALLRDIDLR